MVALIPIVAVGVVAAGRAVVAVRERREDRRTQEAALAQARWVQRRAVERADRVRQIGEAAHWALVDEARRLWGPRW